MNSSATGTSLARFKSVPLVVLIFMLNTGYSHEIYVSKNKIVNNVLHKHTLTQDVDNIML